MSIIIHNQVEESFILVTFFYYELDKWYQWHDDTYIFDYLLFVKHQHHNNSVHKIYSNCLSRIILSIWFCYYLFEASLLVVCIVIKSTGKKERKREYVTTPRISLFEIHTGDIHVCPSGEGAHGSGIYGTSNAAAKSRHHHRHHRVLICHSESMRLTRKALVFSCCMAPMWWWFPRAFAGGECFLLLGINV